MIYLLSKTYINQYHIANLFHYITFRSIIALLLSFVLCIIFGSKIITKLKLWQKSGQPIRELGPESHKAKAGTPTMGGLMMIGAITISVLLLSDITNSYTLILLFVLLGLGILGFTDDYLKVIRKHHGGVSARVKLFWQLLIGFVASVSIYFSAPDATSTHLAIPFLKNLFINLGLFYLVFSSFVIVGASNAVNLTDGLDGLATIPICICAACFGLIAYLTGSTIYSSYLQIIFVPHAADLAVFCSAIVGAGLGFLWFNAQPADVFMGDTASLALGGVLGAIGVITKHEIILAIIGGLFVVETFSVIIQVYYFRKTGGKRFFKMAPLHHHFEKCGWAESKVVIRFWIVSVILAIIGLSSLKLR